MYDCSKECGSYGAVLCREMGLYANCSSYCNKIVSYVQNDRTAINKLKMREIVISHDPGPVAHEKPGAYQFYVDRLLSVPQYGLVAGTDMIKLICRCAFNDGCLTDRESVAIIETCHDPRVHNLLMEVNFNDEWQ